MKIIFGLFLLLVSFSKANADFVINEFDLKLYHGIWSGKCSRSKGQVRFKIVVEEDKTTLFDSLGAYTQNELFEVLPDALSATLLIREDRSSITCGLMNE